MSKSFENSTAHLARAEATIPLGAQTFSKSRTQYPVGYAPLYASRGRKAHLWDIDGNRFVDLVAALGAVSIGYCDRRIDSAVRKQMRSGVTFSLSSKLESEVAELLVSLIPEAEMVRFAKNGSDVTSAAIRLARHVTGKNLVVRSSYHGWHDWYIGSTSRNSGVPSEVQNLTVVLPFNNLEHAQKLFLERGNEISCIILEPVGMDFPVPGFLEGLRSLCNQYGALLIFDEVVTGFRVSKSGAGSLFGISPDLSCFGKGIANGYPLSAIVGKRDFMRELTEVFFSGTFGGEALSLAAAKSVLSLVKEGLVVEHLEKIGRDLENRISKLLADNKFDFLQLSGHPSWKFLKWNIESPYLDEAKTLFLQEMMQEGILILNTFNIMTSLSKQDLEQIERAFVKTLPKLDYSIKSGDFKRYLKAEPIRPLFKVR
jgi:glutamate-1-semialdehyde 2,1-aminomutase